MADEHESTPGGIPGLTQEVMAQLRNLNDRLAGLTGLGASLPTLPSLTSLPGLKNLPVPGAMTAAQLKSIATTVAAQRSSIDALKNQLTSFDEQLGLLERILGPLADWSSKWAQVEDRLMKLHPEPGTGSSSHGDSKA
ncbi:MAG: hypothetical protein ABSB01_16770 [Streptosporangiaceae bacterium]|jgi:hypothetical protein